MMATSDGAMIMDTAAGDLMSFDDLDHLELDGLQSVGDDEGDLNTEQPDYSQQIIPEKPNSTGELSRDGDHQFGHLDSTNFKLHHLHARPSTRHVVYNSEEHSNYQGMANNNNLHQDEEVLSDSCFEESLSSLSSSRSTTPVEPSASHIQMISPPVAPARRGFVKVRPLEAPNDMQELPVYKFLTESPIEKEIRILMEREAELRRDKGLPPLASQTTDTKHRKMDSDVSSAALETFRETSDNNNNNDDDGRPIMPFGILTDCTGANSNGIRKDGDSMLVDKSNGSGYHGKGSMMDRFIASRGKIVPEYRTTFQRRQAVLRASSTSSLPPVPLITAPVSSSVAASQSSPTVQMQLSEPNNETMFEKWGEGHEHTFFPLKRSRSSIETKIRKELNDMKIREDELRQHRRTIDETE